MANRVSVYFEQEILSANNLQLVHILYQSAINELRDAKRNLAARKIPEKCENFRKSCALIGELMRSLDLDAGGEIAARLKSLYEYMLNRLLQANVHNLEEPVSEVMTLLTTLDEGWKQLAAPKPRSEQYPAAQLSTAGAAVRFGSSDSDVPSQVWSF